MREIAVLFALEDVEFNLEASGELSISGLHVLTKVFGRHVQQVISPSEPLCGLCTAGLGRLREDMLDKPDICVRVDRGELRLHLEPFPGPSETVGETHTLFFERPDVPGLPRVER